MIKKKFLFYPGFYRYWKKLKSIRKPILYYKTVRFPIRDIVNCGTPRSGSTLLHNIIQHILFVNYFSNYNYCGNELDYMNLKKNNTIYLLSKIHSYSPIIEKRIKKGLSFGFFSHRDIRDIIASEIQKGWINNLNKYLESGSNRRLINDSLLYAKITKMNVISYYELMFNRYNVIKNIADILQVDLNDNQINNIIEETSIRKAKKNIEKAYFKKQGTNFVDCKTGLHSNHINDPSIGKWKKVLSVEQEKLIIEDSKDYFDYFGYKY